MAVDLGPQVKPMPKHEAFVEQQLARTRGRIRALDVAALGLVLLLGTLGYCLVMTLLDQVFQLPLGVRLAAFAVYAAAALGFLVWAGLRLLSRQINPYYAARQIEQTLPDAKNSVVNWLDLREADLPPAIRGALGQRAARDLKQADLDRAVSTRRTSWLGGAVLLALVAVLALYVGAGAPFLSLLQRAFAPFQEVAIATRTTLTLLQPEGGDVTVLVGRPVTFRVHVEGRVPQVNQPDALRLYYRYNPTDPYASQGLEPDLDGDWAVTLLGDQVQNGLWYKIGGGDAETPEYQVRVRSQAQVTGFEVKYHYRPYRNRPDEVVHYPNQDAVAPHLTGHRGTEVTLTAHANRAVQEGHLEFDLGGQKKELVGKIPPGQPEVLQFQFTLERSGTYRVLFTATDREGNTDQTPYRISVVADRAPLVQLSKPGKDVQLPANGTLPLEGRAEDDFGITRMTLRMRVEGGPSLQGKPYRAGKSFRLANGDYPEALDYKDFVELDKVKTQDGAPFALTPGMELKYWLEAQDNCDYPDKAGNAGRSKEYTVKITPPETKSEQQQERQAAQQAQKNHEQRQDQKQEQRNQKSKSGQQDGQRTEQKAGAGQGSDQSQKEFENKARQLENALKDQEKQQAAKNQQKQDNGSSSKESNKEGDASTKPQDQQAQSGQDPSTGKQPEKNNSQDKQGQSKSENKSDAAKSQDKNQSAQGSQAGQDKQAGQQQAAGSQQDPGKSGQQEKKGQNQTERKQDGAKSQDKNQSAQGNQSGQDKQAAGSQQDPNKTGQQEKKGENQTERKQEGTNGQPKQAPGQSANGQEKKQPQASNSPGPKKNQPSGQDPKAGPQASGEKKTDTQAASGKKDAGNSNKAEGSAKSDAPPKQGGQKNDGATAGKQDTANQASGAEKTAAEKQQPGPGQANERPAAAPKGSEKPGDKAGPSQAKAGANEKNDSGSSPSPNSSKQSPEKTRPEGQAKNNQGTNNQSTPNRENATQEDVAKLREDLKGPQAQQAAEDLSRIAQQAKDQQVRNAAGDALKEASARADEAAKDANQQKVAQLKKLLQDPEQKQGAAEALARVAEKAQDAKVREAAQDALKVSGAQAKGPEQRQDGDKNQTGKQDNGPTAKTKSQNPTEQIGQAPQKNSSKKGEQSKSGDAQTAGDPGNQDKQQDAAKNPGGVSQKSAQGNFNENKAQQPANEDFSRRGGVLQLEDLKKKVTPELLKKLNWTEKDWQQFQEQARRYEAARQQTQPPTGKDRLRPGSSLLPSTGPRQVGSGPESRADDVTGSQALPPPEFREAQRIFTSRPEGGTTAPGKN